MHNICSYRIILFFYFDTRVYNVNVIATTDHFLFRLYIYIYARVLRKPIVSVYIYALEDNIFKIIPRFYRYLLLTPLHDAYSDPCL